MASSSRTILSCSSRRLSITESRLLGVARKPPNPRYGSSRAHATALSNSPSRRLTSLTGRPKTSPLLSRHHDEAAAAAAAVNSRLLASSTAHRAAIINPRKDEDGNEMNIEITPRAANRLRQIMTTDANPDLALRVTVESGGCHGFQYLMSLTDTSKISPDDDTVFEGAEGAKVVLDEPSLELLKGSKVDYTMELIGSQFKIVDNPLATSSCGCGTSFDIKA